MAGRRKTRAMSRHLAREHSTTLTQKPTVRANSRKGLGRMGRRMQANLVHRKVGLKVNYHEEVVNHPNQVGELGSLPLERFLPGVSLHS
jgi:hypothetical protein